MTGPLHEVLKKGDTVHIKVDKRSRDFYSMKYSHDFIGIVDDVDDEHIWVRGPVRNIDGESYVGQHRYCWLDITLERA